MKLKIYFLSVFIIAFTLSGFTPPTQAQDSNIRAIACNGCNEKAKQQEVQNTVSHDYPQGEYRFMVIDMQGANVHEYNVNITAKLGQSSQETRVTLIHNPDQALQNQRVKDVKVSIEKIDKTVNDLFNNAMPIPENSPYTSAYHALHHKAGFDSYINSLLKDTLTISNKIRETNLAIQLMAKSLQIDASIAVSISSTLNIHNKTWGIFIDNSKIKVTFNLIKLENNGIELNATATNIALDQNDNLVPINKLELIPYNFSDSGLNESAFQSYFNSIGITIEFSEGWTNRSGSCDTKWACSSNKKTCDLQVSNCQ